MNHEENLRSLEETILGEERVYDGHVVKLNLARVKLPDGKDATREVIRHVGAAAIVPVDEQGNVTLVRQYRTALGRVLTEIPAGKLSAKDEDRLLAAQRELREETGLTAENWVHLTDVVTTPGFCDERISIYLATGLSQGQDSPDEDEFLNVFTVPLERLVEMALQGEIEDGKTLTGILMAQRYFEA